jgi:hypothetical protein
MAVGFSAFAGIMLIVVGVFQFFAGLAAIFEDTVYVLTADHFLAFDATAWGWIHMLIGLVLVLAGFGIFGGQIWARTLGVVIAGISAIANFVFLFGWNQPFWSILIIIIDVFVIWALTVHGRDIAQP